MPRKPRAEYMRHEKTLLQKPAVEEVFLDYHAAEEDSFETGESGFVATPKPTNVDSLGRKKGGRRSTKDMLASMPNTLSRCTYILERAASLEDSLHELFALVTADELEIIAKQRPGLTKYFPEID